MDYGDCSNYNEQSLQLVVFMEVILFSAILVAVILGLQYWVVTHAPTGYEDADGFHYGKKPAPKDRK